MPTKIIENRVLLKERGFDEPLTSKEGKVRNILSRLAGIYNYPIDVENTTFTKISPSEANIKTSNVLFIFKFLQSGYRNHKRVNDIAVYEGCMILKGGKKIMGNIVDPNYYILESGEKVYYDRKKDLSTASPAFCKQYANTAYVLDDELKLLKDIRKDRMQAKSGSIDRIDPWDYGYHGGDKVDKSGYLFDPRKYQKMLAAVKKESYQGIFDEAIGYYNELTEYIQNVEKEELSLDSPTASGYIGFRTDRAEKARKDMRNNLVYFANAFRKNKPDEIVRYAEYIKQALPKLKETVEYIRKTQQL